MREIKFRGWDKELNFMINIKRYKIDFNGQVLFDNNDKELYNQTNKIELMQYTGFKIKNKEVYEGDIIKGRKDTVYKVVFERGCFFLYHVNLFNPDKNNLRWGLLSRLFDSDMIDIEKDCEIIGNIHENPELLN